MPRILLRSLPALVLTICGPVALTHDIWINRSTCHNPTEKWCCDAEDCGIVNPGVVNASRRHHALRGIVTYGEFVTRDTVAGPTIGQQINEAIAYSRALLSPDDAPIGAARVPDGSPRRFFALSPRS